MSDDKLMTELLLLASVDLKRVPDPGCDGDVFDVSGIAGEARNAINALHVESAALRATNYELFEALHRHCVDDYRIRVGDVDLVGYCSECSQYLPHRPTCLLAVKP